MIKKNRKTAYFLILAMMFIHVCTISSLGASTKI